MISLCVPLNACHIKSYVRLMVIKDLWINSYYTLCNDYWNCQCVCCIVNSWESLEKWWTSFLLVGIGDAPSVVLSKKRSCQSLLKQTCLSKHLKHPHLEFEVNLITVCWICAESFGSCGGGNKVMDLLSYVWWVRLRICIIPSLRFLNSLSVYLLFYYFNCVTRQLLYSLLDNLWLDIDKKTLSYAFLTYEHNHGPF